MMDKLKHIATKNQNIFNNIEEIEVANLKEGHHFGELESVNIKELILNKKALSIAEIKKKYKNKSKQLENFIVEEFAPIKNFLTKYINNDNQ